MGCFENKKLNRREEQVPIGDELRREEVEMVSFNSHDKGVLLLLLVIWF